MKNIRKILPLFLVLILALTACGKRNAAEEEKTDENKTPDTEQSAEQSPDAQPGELVPIVTEDAQPGEYVSAMLTQYVSKGKYYMKQKTTEEGKEVIIEVAVEGDKAALRDESGTQIIDGETLYYVIPAQKAVLTSPVADSMKKGYTAIINVKTEEEAKAALQGTGKETIQDKEYTYEEYKNAEGKLERYYFDSTTIRFIKQFEDDGTEKLTEILGFTTEIPANFFEVPDGYIVQDLSKMQSSN